MGQRVDTFVPSPREQTPMFDADISATTEEVFYRITGKISTTEDIEKIKASAVRHNLYLDVNIIKSLVQNDKQAGLNI